MKSFMKNLLAAAALGLISVGAAANTLTWQGVTFSINTVDADTFSLTIDDAVTGGTGDWSSINYINAFSLKDLGSISSMSLSDWTVSSLELNAHGCSGGSSGDWCFTHNGGPLSLTDHMVFNIDYVGVLDLSAPHLKVEFMETNALTYPVKGDPYYKATGDLLSQTIPAIPEPETYALMLAGLGAVGFMARRRRQV